MLSDMEREKLPNILIFYTKMLTCLEASSLL
jgi:hypothetical protein